MAQDRAHGSLLGLAIGDALGMPTQSFSHAEIARRFTSVRGFLDAPADQPIAPGMPAGSITDDTDQALLLADLLVAGAGRVDPHAFGDALLEWEARMIARGSLDLLGPSTKAALTALAAGTSVEQTGRFGTTNGAAMRIAPVGIASPPGPELVEAVVEASRVTHNTGLGISAAAAVAAAVSAGVDGAGVPEALEVALSAAAEGATRGYWEPGGHIAARFTALREPARAVPDARLPLFLDEVVGTSVQSQESVVAALLLADRFADRPFEGLCVAAAVGGDTDTIGAIAGAVLGACRGAGALPADARETVERVNGLKLESVAAKLLELRAAARNTP